MSAERERLRERIEAAVFDAYEAGWMDPGVLGFGFAWKKAKAKLCAPLLALLDSQEQDEGPNALGRAHLDGYREALEDLEERAEPVAWVNGDHLDAMIEKYGHPPPPMGHEVDDLDEERQQPASPFILRLRKGPDGVLAALFEADGGAWQHDAAEAVAEYLRASCTAYQVYA